MGHVGNLASSWPKTSTFFPPKLAILILTNSVKSPSDGFFGDFGAGFAAWRPSGTEIRSPGDRPPPRRCSGVGAAMSGGLRGQAASRNPRLRRRLRRLRSRLCAISPIRCRFAARMDKPTVRSKPAMSNHIK